MPLSDFLLTYPLRNDKIAFRKQFLLSKKPRKGNDDMRNYVKEIEFIERRRTSCGNFFLPVLAGLFFIGYSGLIFMDSQGYYEIFLASSVPLALGIPAFAFSRVELSDGEREIRNEIREARKFLEKSSGKADNEGINALVDLYRSQKGDNKWESIGDMFREAFPEKSELRKAVTGIL